ncbi:uncharacterized protein LOC111338555 [Stylophora pistillata]|uniref:uncharacterized protein LOC111338555 n=1 Tax=Stylophora pistillata TaxID=50429 RepID=UPI000C038DE3|nr:uncharacterized protein LOC111338555 [Stylophora pistillata]
MAGSILIEVFGKIAFSFTRSVMEHYHPEEPEFTIESFGLNPLESTGREWYYRPVDELIYQEYSNEETTSTNHYHYHYLAVRGINVRLINACSVEEHEEIQDEKPEERAMAWKQLRPSFMKTICKSMYIGALISLITASVIGAIYLLFSYFMYKTLLSCAFVPERFITESMQWIITVWDLTVSLIFHFGLFCNTLFLFRRHQLHGLKKMLFLISFAMYCLHALYCVILQAVNKPYAWLSPLYRIPIYLFIAMGPFLQLWYLAKSFGVRSGKKMIIHLCKLMLPGFLTYTIAFVAIYFVYPAYQKQKGNGKLLIAIFAPLIGVIAKVLSRISVQQLWNITHPGYSYVLLVPLYFGAAVVCRLLQAELDGLLYIVVLGVIHGITEVVERSTMVLIDHFCHQLWKRKSAPWGSFRTPRRERLMADIAIISMMFESIAIVSVNGFLFFYQFIYLLNDSFSNLILSLVIYTTVPLVIEWFFTSVSLAIETRYQNMPVMAVWRWQWKRHVLVAVVNAILLSAWSSGNLLNAVSSEFIQQRPKLNRTCKM